MSAVPCMTVSAPTIQDGVPDTAGPTDRRPARRLSAIDIVRGTFMLIILAGHAGGNLNHWPAARAFEDAFGPLFLSGTVGFTVVSGTLLGTFAATRPDMGPILSRYRRQGLRLLFIAHPLISLALYLPLRDPGDGFLRFLALRHYVTDVLAVLFIAVAPLIPKVSPRVRLGAGIASLVGLHLLRQTTAGADGFWLVVREIFLGVQPHAAKHILIDSYALLGILGMFLIGTYVGDFIGRSRKSGDLARASKRLLQAAVLVQIATVALLGTWLGLKTGVLPDFGGRLRQALYPERMGSIFPAYLGFVLALLALALRRDAADARLSFSERAIEVVGKTSLFSYVVQYYIVQTIPCLLGLQHHMSVQWMTVWTVASIGVLVLVASLWNKHVKKV